MTTQQSLFKYCLRLGDNATILGYRLSEWCSNAPLLEEDLALTNFALDMTGRAQAILKYAGEVEGLGHSEDDLAYHRDERHYYNNLLAEMPNGDFAYSMTKQLFISVFEQLFFTELQKSSDATLSGIAAKTLKEVKYHLAHATNWALRLGDGTTESHNRMQQSVDALWMYTGELFEMDEVDAAVIAAGIGVDLAPLKAKWAERVTLILEEAKLAVPEDGYMQTGSRKAVHTEHLGHILSEMQYLQRSYPDAKW